MHSQKGLLFDFLFDFRRRFTGDSLKRAGEIRQIVKTAQPCGFADGSPARLKYPLGFAAAKVVYIPDDRISGFTPEFAAEIVFADLNITRDFVDRHRLRNTRIYITYRKLHAVAAPPGGA